MNTTDVRFTAKAAVKLTGVSYDTLDYWATTGFIKPSITPADGTGSRREYSFADLVALRVALELRNVGITLQSLRRIVEYLEQRGVEKPLTSTYLVSDGVDVYECRGDELSSVLSQPGQRAFRFIVDLGTTARKLAEAVSLIRKSA